MPHESERDHIGRAAASAAVRRRLAALGAGSRAIGDRSERPARPASDLQTDGTGPRPATPASTLSDKLARTDGVICPPNVDPEIKAPTPESGNKMPVIPPPGSPGGDPSIQPK